MYSAQWLPRWTVPESTVGRVAGAEPHGRHSLTRVLETAAQAGEGRQRRGEIYRPKRAMHEGQDLDTRSMEDLEHVLSRSDTRSPIGKGSTCGWGRASLRVRMGSRETPQRAGGGCW